MKYLHLFENFRNLKVSKFIDMPRNYQIGILIRSYEVNDDINWSINLSNIDWINDIKNVDILISDYSFFYPEKRFSYGFLSLDEIIGKIKDSEILDDYEDWDDYHTCYSSTNNLDYNDLSIPILVDEREEEFIEDGWHRFHYYIDKGMKNIPVVSFNI